MPDSTPAFWQEEYIRLLGQRLDRSLDYLRATPPAEQRTHAHSFLTLLSETHRYPELTGKALEFIAALHPLPVRWELTYAWGAELRFALEHTPRENLARRAEYRCALGDLLLFDGRFDEAIEQCNIVMQAAQVPVELEAKALRILFLSLRYSGRGDETDVILARVRERFMGDRPAAEVPAGMVGAWMEFNLCWLQKLREKGQVDEAIALAGEMIALDRRCGSVDLIRSADLLTQRSTLNWLRLHYAEAIDDLNDCIALYRQAGDFLNAESRLSNLGLVYWSMGELDPAEANLKAALDLYRKIGMDQMYTYVSGNLGLVYLFRGAVEDAVKTMQEQVRLAKKLNYTTEIKRGQWNLAIARCFQGDYSEIMDVYQETLAHYEKRGNRDAHYFHWIWVAFWREKNGDKAAAIELMQDVIRVSREQKMSNLEQIALRCLASLLPLEERGDLLQQSLDLATSTSRKFEAAAAWLMMAQAARDPERRRLAWETGARMLREMGAERWLEGYSLDDPPFLPPFI
ncbi:hypothetical protein LARV_01057 [Longilinea arvoryzae]|uniref:Anaphase-promoting complex subunit 5 domain-containing protein n=1 Tax=Longilinea arvoryzae TaxID=360412 RepID=A0A0S7BGK5_9CHLR|nr:tetratricopeptide repeat protein [Longilinea arvoryzae]GAP13304.1 hypothetical protein LARV_01057 [Longilinea arvoryzae]